MDVKVATTTSFHWSGSHTAIPHHPCLSQALTSSKRRRSRARGEGSSLSSQTMRLKASTFLRTQSGKLHRSKSCELLEFSTKPYPLRRVCSASSGFFSSDEEFSAKMQELALQFKKEDDFHRTHEPDRMNHRFGNVKLLLQESVPGLASLEAPWIEMVNHSSIERKANSVDLPLSLRMIKRKLQEEEALKVKEARESTYCSIDKAFSSMVFMIEEMHSFALQTREVVFYEGCLKHVKKDMHASLLWIFQRVFSQTPTLMVYVMILLANFTVHSVASNLAIAASPPDSAVIEEATKGQRESVLGQGIREEELSLWNSMVEEAEQMQDSSVDRDMRLRLVSPIIARVALDDSANYTRTELLYKLSLAQEPNNTLLLANYAQFLYLVSQDYDRADKCFKKAIESGEIDAEVYSKYAIFQWKVRKDLWAAEENFLEAISVDPTNSFYAASYANFLWQTGGEETCFPLESFDSPQEIA
ncbi:unnamed protein product [Eruca vesicaria subsp. sativa]|uniref:Tetratricopeptide repeat-like superfamily protein n=1 Tax=Eruca vesicaria subsp. sativa TaxID=29727 RepID=A0ABC8LF34_ERUVS|nr:unnamed protein product [Eruca vesicaria subsp. sativa]